MVLETSTATQIESQAAQPVQRLQRFCQIGVAGSVKGIAPDGLEAGGRVGVGMPRPRKPANPFRYFHSSPEVIRLVVLMYVRFPLSLRNVEDLLFERGIDLCHETVRLWWNRFGPLFAADIRRQRVSRMRGFRHWQWHVDEVYVRINGEMHYLWRAVDHEGEILESYATKTRDKAAGPCQDSGAARRVVLDCPDAAQIEGQAAQSVQVL